MPNPTHPEQNPKPSAEVDIDALPDNATPEQIAKFKASWRQAFPARYPPGGNGPYDTSRAKSDRDRDDEARARGGR